MGAVVRSEGIAVVGSEGIAVVGSEGIVCETSVLIMSSMA